MADAGKSKDERMLESLQAEVAELRAQLENEQLRARRESSQQSNAHHSLMAITGLFRLYTDDNGVMMQTQNWPHRMGATRANAHISELFQTDEARAYFKEVYDLRHQFQKPTRDDQAANWRCVFSSEGGTGPSLDTWVSNSPTGWTCEGGTATTGDSLDAAELYLSSPVKLVGPEDDFRIEYMARADEEPQDLSVVVGSSPRFEMGSWQALRPDAAGYGFVFGGMHNMSTELQRCMRRVSQAVEGGIVAGHDHHCVAQRIGGRLEFVVDGETV